MSSKNEILFSVLSLGIFIVSASILSGYLGSVGMKQTPDKIEGFEGSEENVDNLIQKIEVESEDVKDTLNIDKYDMEYKKLTSLSKEYLDGLQLSTLLTLKAIDPKSDNIDVIISKCSKVALLLKTLGDGSNSIKDIDIGLINGGTSSKKSPGWY